MKEWSKSENNTSTQWRRQEFWEPNISDKNINGIWPKRTKFERLYLVVVCSFFFFFIFHYLCTSKRSTSFVNSNRRTYMKRVFLDLLRFVQSFLSLSLSASNCDKVKTKNELVQTLIALRSSNERYRRRILHKYNTKQKKMCNITFRERQAMNMLICVSCIVFTGCLHIDNVRKSQQETEKWRERVRTDQCETGRSNTQQQLILWLKIITSNIETMPMWGASIYSWPHEPDRDK